MSFKLKMDECCSSPTRSGGEKLLITLVGIVLVYAIVFLGTLIRNNIQKFHYIGKEQGRTIVVEGQGKVSVRPNVAVTSMGVTNEAATVAEAQKKNSEVMNKLIAALKKMGVEEKDIQTANYNVYPQYTYRDNDQVLKGYQVNQNVTVKIRNLENANNVLALVGEVGANNVSGLSFIVDDPEQFKMEARKQALEKIQKKVASLSEELGVQVIGVVNYSEFEGGMYSGGSMMKMMDSGMGMGGGSPQVEAGMNDVLVNVNVTYEIR